MRRAGITAGAVVAALIAILVLLPWWLGAALRPVARHFGVTFERYERVGYARFALDQVEVNRVPVHVTIDRVEVATPLFWLWRHWRNSGAAVTAGKWNVAIEGGGRKKPAVPDAGWLKLRGQLQRIADALDDWIGRGEIGPGRVEWPGGMLNVDGAQWHAGVLQATGLRFGAVAADGILTFATGEGRPLQLELHAKNSDGTVVLRSAGADVTGNVQWWGQPASVQAHFAPTGWRPETAALRAEDWNVAGERLKLGEFFETVRGTIDIAWQKQAFEAHVSAHSTPRADKKVPPLEVEARARGDGATFLIESLNATLPGIQATLDQPVTITRRGRLVSGAANFTWKADLAKQEWFKARGVVNGSAHVTAGDDQRPLVAFSVEGSNVNIARWSVPHAAAEGTLAWPRLAMKQFVVRLAGGDEVRASGTWDFARHALEKGELQGHVGGGIFARWLPPEVHFERARFTAQGAGVWPALQHNGELTITHASAPRLRAMDVAAHWSGAGEEIERAEITARTGEATIAAKGSISRTGAKLDALTLTAPTAAALALKAPVVMRWSPQIEVEGLALAGGETSVDATVKMGRAGRVQIAASNVASEWCRAFFVLPPPIWIARAVKLDAAWDNGPAKINALADVRFDLKDQGAVALSLAAHSEDQGLVLDHLNVSENGHPVVSATGRLPIVVSPAADELVRATLDGDVRLDASTEPEAAFWEELRAATGIELVSPQVTVHVSGTWRSPRGEADLQAKRVALDPGRFKQNWPAIGPLALRMTGDANAVALQRFTVAVEGQEINAEASLPIGSNWKELRADPLTYLQDKAEVRLEIANAEVAPFVRFAPQLLAPKGRVQADVRLTPGGAMHGSVRLTGLATRPLGGVGVLQDLAANLKLAGRTVEVESVSGKAGGQTVKITGKVELPMHEQPRYDLRMAGDNLPFVRSMGLLVRGNLDLTLTTPDRGPPAIGGSVVLRDSLFFSDVRAMIPGGPRGPSQRPPYFAVDVEPFRRWTLGVSVRGDKFLRLRTPLFNGVASTKLQLKGTLGSPLLSGEATIDSGKVRLPFATFDVQQGRVLLSDQPPFEPRLEITATARRYDYDLRMEVTGTASAPNLVFSSSPPLESEQVLLMVMAGEVPNQAITFSQRQRATRLGAYVGQSLFSTFGGDSDFADRLTISSGDDISLQGRETYSIEYRLNDRWSLTGEYDEFDEYNAGVKWRVLREKKDGDGKKKDNDEKK
ncbi:translocation/assembly module TamB [Horticoccus luteus]|uniref:Translocation/assembly module TamB n=1 Tax=Horticoccus luteus TaxID=2862869 RepID=A0A8F9TZD9_9BACT|nr:translocation/assembly module TamB domain-containing protein [Horticoccus luteus]QYM80312.1 translocation/assembly module TamB [Horticoccus luteus]